MTGGRLNAARMLEGIDSIPPGPTTDLASGLVSSTASPSPGPRPETTGGREPRPRPKCAIPSRRSTPRPFPRRRAAGVPAPRSAGSREEAVIRGLTPSTDYWIALVTRDEYGNPSPLSNVIAVRTTEPPVRHRAGGDRDHAAHGSERDGGAEGAGTTAPASSTSRLRRPAPTASPSPGSPSRRSAEWSQRAVRRRSPCP